MKTTGTSRSTPSASTETRSSSLGALLGNAAHGLYQIRSGRSGAVALDGTAPALRAGAQAVLYHALRHLGLAESLRSLLAPRTPPPAADALLCTTLAVAAAPTGMSYEGFTLVNQAVEAAKADPATRQQAGFINACLRRFLRERETLLAAVAADPVAQWNHPRWWIARMRKEWPDQWQSVLTANNAQAPMVLRINEQKSTPSQYVKDLAAIEIAAFEMPPHAVVLERAVPVQELPGFAQGVVSVQDASAQRAAPLLLAGLLPGTPLRVLDACAAPGGKTAHLLEHAGSGADIELTALDVDPARCVRISETLARVGMSAQVLAHDAGKPEDWWQQHCKGQAFDAILLDAPCTASGIVRRHPDVRWLRRESDIAQLAKIQAELLAALWPLVKVGGRMLYCTCSVFHAEGQDQIETFLARNSDALLLPSPGHILPAAADMAGRLPDNGAGGYDGFYFALLQKVAL
ncbi:MAG: 16S rRNA (cytosine(967)-C(5))-methyltransferase RsmB [Giesbergeria sp.]